MMKKISYFLCMLLLPVFSALNVHGKFVTPLRPKIQYVDLYNASVTFPANYAIGDYIEFVRLSPGLGSGGYYQVSMTYTRAGIAAAATHTVAVSHNNAAVWREAGRVNNNGYINSEGQNFTIDCNTDPSNPRLRIRAINTIGVTSVPLTVYLKVNAIGFNDAYTALSATGSDLSINKLLPMTGNWDLLVGNPTSVNGAAIAIKVLENGNVGINTNTPTDKLAVNGNIRAKEIKVETAGWPDYVFEKEYQLSSLAELDAYIKLHKRLPRMPSAKSVAVDGINLGELNTKLLEKIEELTLHLIEKDKQLNALEQRLRRLENSLKKDKL